MRLRLAMTALGYSVFINVQANMAAGACQINMDMFFTDCKLPTIHSKSVQRSRSKAIKFSDKTNKTRYIQSSLFFTDNISVYLVLFNG